MARAIQKISIENSYQTPPEVARYMVDLIDAKEIDVLEPTPGIGNIVSELNNKGFNVTAPDDFFLLNKKEKFDCIIMNPPFSSKSANMANAPKLNALNGMKVGYYILTECMKMSNHVIALMPWFTISDSDVRLRHLKNYGLKSITALPRKTFNYLRIQTVVIELKKGFKGKCEFKVFEFPPRANKQNQLKLF